MVTPKGQVKVLDFGLARILRAVGEASATESFTQTQNMAGTLPYMAPEQLRGEPADARTDIHALGAVLFETADRQAPLPRRLGSPIDRCDSSSTAGSPAGSECAGITRAGANHPEVPGERAREPLSVGQGNRCGPAPVERAVGRDSCCCCRPAPRRRMFLPLAGVLLVALALVGAAYLYLHRAPKLTEKDSIVLADFTNTTGDPVFDGTLRQGLSVELEQTPFLSLVSGDRITQTLRLMEKPPDTRLTQDVAREVCQRANATAEIEGSIAALGNQYVLGLNAVNCNTGETLAGNKSPRRQGKSAWRSWKRRLRAPLETRGITRFAGQARHPVGSGNHVLPRRLAGFALGDQPAFSNPKCPRRIPHYGRAVSSRSQFRDRSLPIGACSCVLGDDRAAERENRAAYELRDRTSEFERFAIEANYHFAVTQNFDKMAQVGKAWAQAYRATCTHSVVWQPVTRRLAGLTMRSVLSVRYSGLIQQIEAHSLRGHMCT